MGHRAGSESRAGKPPVPWRLSRHTWGRVLRRVWKQISEDNLGIVAAGVAFFAILALVPALAATVSIYGLVANPSDIEALIGSVVSLAPRESQSLLGNVIRRSVLGSPQALTYAATGSILISVWSANRGMKALIIAIDIATREQPRRGIVRENLVSLLFTVAAVGGFVVMVVGVVALPHLLDLIGVPTTLGWLLAVFRWPVLFLVFQSALALLYRYAPAERPTRWRWVTIGSVAATVCWLLASAVLSLYSSYLTDYDDVYGPISGVVALAIWLYVTAYTVLLGAELDSELDRVVHGEVEGGERRGAYAADHGR